MIDQRLLQKEWATEATSAYAKARPPIAKAIKAYENACLKGEQPNTEIDVTSRAILSKAYNPEDVEKIIAKLEIFKRLQPHMGKVKTGTADDFEDVKAELIKEGMLSYVPTAERERKKSMEALLADPVKWAEKSGLIPDINFEMGKFGQTMSERFTGLKEVEKKYNITVPNILGKAGEKRLLDKIKKGSSHDVVSFLSSEADLLSFDDKEKLRTAVGASEDVSLSVGGRLALRDSDSDREASAFIFTGSKSKEALNLQYKRENNKRSIDRSNCKENT